MGVETLDVPCVCVVTDRGTSCSCEAGCASLVWRMGSLGALPTAERTSILAMKSQACRLSHAPDCGLKAVGLGLSAQTVYTGALVRRLKDTTTVPKDELR